MESARDTDERMAPVSTQPAEDLPGGRRRPSFPGRLRMCAVKSRVASMDRPRITQEEIARLEPGQREAVLESLDAGLSLSPEEDERRKVAREFAPAEVWGATASSCLVHIVESFRRGDVDIGRALSDMQRISVGATPQFRILLLGILAARLLQERPDHRKRGQRPPKWPQWLRTATADLVIVEHLHNPYERRTPAPYFDKPSSPVIERALGLLIRCGWFGAGKPPSPGTVDDWVRARLKDKPAQ